MQFVRNYIIKAGVRIEMPAIFRPLRVQMHASSPDRCNLTVLFQTETTMPWIFNFYDMHRTNGFSLLLHYMGHDGHIALFGLGVKNNANYPEVDALDVRRPDGNAGSSPSNDGAADKEEPDCPEPY